MKRNFRFFYAAVVASVAIAAAPFLFGTNFTAHAQGNTISGFVFGANRQPMADLTVEVQNDYYSTIARTRTSSSGQYNFSGLPISSAYYLRINTYQAPEYEDYEQRVEMQNISVQSPGGGSHSTSDFQQVDVYLRLRRGITPAAVAVFAQDLPPEAKKLYDKGVADLDNKRTAEGLAELKGAIEIFPKYYYALERLGTEYISMEKPEGFEAAEVLFSAAVGVNPRGYRSWYGLAYARYRRGEYDTAMTAVMKAVELNSYSPDAELLYGSLLKRAGKFPEAEKQLLKANEASKGTNSRVHFELALLYGNEMKRYAEAAKELKTFLKLEPNAKDAENIKKLIADFEAKAGKK